jgi:hypothetical protein
MQYNRKKINYLIFDLEVPDEGDLHGAVCPLDVAPQLHELLVKRIKAKLYLR